MYKLLKQNQKTQTKNQKIKQIKKFSLITLLYLAGQR